MANSQVTDKKIDWLAKHGYIIPRVLDGVTSYIVTDKGKVYLNDKDKE